VAGVIPEVKMVKPIPDAVHDMPVWRERQVSVPLEVDVP
jgi:hypothetical protein